MVRNQKDNTNILATAYTITNFGEDKSLSSTEAGAANVAAVLTTVIRDLIRQGILIGTVA